MDNVGESWKPTASLKNIQARAALYQRIREYFQHQGVLEVEVPLLSQAAVSDPQLDVIEASCCRHPAYLQTSPEFGLKRLLAAGVGSCYSLGKAFRNDEAGSRHNPEFTMLEWYRLGFDDQQLMRDVNELLRCLLPPSVCTKDTVYRSYREVFQTLLGVDPHQASVAKLKQAALNSVSTDLTSFAETEDKDVWLDLLMSHCVEPSLDGIQFIYDYPATQAALARCVPDQTGMPVARRFELYVNGVELANGYWELTDVQQLAQRFEKDQAYRRSAGLPCRPVDARLIAAHKAGLPDCAGVALGIDRLLMVILQTTRIDEVIALPFPRA